jgi:hypothetical protein
VAEFTEGGVRKLMLVTTAGAAGQLTTLRYRTLTVSGGGWRCFPGDWSAEQAVDTAGIGSAPTAVYDTSSATIEVFASYIGQLRRWSYAPGSGWLIKNRIQTVDGVNSVPAGSRGAGMTMGYLLNNSTKFMFAAIQRSNAPIDIYRRSSPDRWLKEGTVAIRTDTKPAIAYVPESNAAPLEGRFYVAAAERDPAVAACKGQGAGNCPVVGFSRGNCESGCADRQLATWTTMLHGVEEDAVLGGSSFALFYDPAFDTNLRSAVATDQIWFQPLADGIYKTTIMKDGNDYEIMAKNAKCVFGVGACKQCMSENANGTCAQWQ